MGHVILNVSDVIDVTSDCRRHSAAQSSDGRHGNLFGTVFGGAAMSRGHHVGLEQGSLQIHMMIEHSLVHCC